MCAVCPEAVPKNFRGTCGPCGGIEYCSLVCQKKDWPNHKLICKQVKICDPPPGPSHVRAIYFAEDGSGPSLLWLRIHDDPITDDSEPKLKVDVSSLNLSPEQESTLRDFRVLENSPTLRRRFPPITWSGSWVQVGEYSYMSGKNNSSVGAIDKELSESFYGHLIYYVLDRNLGGADFCNIVEHLRWEDYEKRHKAAAQYCLSPGVPSLIVPCFGERALCHQPYYTTWMLPESTLRRDNGEAIELPLVTAIGIPLVAFSNRFPALLWRGRELKDTRTGLAHPAEANFMLRTLDPVMYYQEYMRPGTLCFARNDKKPVSPFHLDVLCQYFEHVARAFPWPDEGETKENERSWKGYLQCRFNEIEKNATGVDFLAFWEDFVKKAKARDENFDCPSPYDI